VNNILATDPATFNGLIAKVGFHNNKTKYILQATQVCDAAHQYHSQHAAVSGFGNSYTCQCQGVSRFSRHRFPSSTQILKDRFDSDVPSSVDDLVSLPGVGPKMAFITLSAAHGVCWRGAALFFAV
jgi:endonuclease-3